MTAEEAYLLSLCRAGYLRAAPPDPPAGLNWADVFDIANKHKVCPLAADGTLLLPETALAQADREIALQYQALARISELEQYIETTAYTKLLEEAGVDYCLLKGWHWRALYPFAYLRSMCDVDILIRLKDWHAACEAARTLGYVQTMDIDLHAVYCKGEMKLELHRGVLSSRNAHANLLRDIWPRLSRVGDSREWRMSPADEYLYFFLHAEKHVSCYLFTLRMFTDIVALQAGIKADRAQFMREAERIGLRQYVENIEGLAEAWIEDRPLSPEQRQMNDYLMGLGWLNDAEFKYRNAAHWLRVNLTPLNAFRKFFLSNEEMRSRHAGLAKRQALSANIREALHTYKTNLRAYRDGLKSIPARRRRELANGERRLYAK